MKRLQILFIWLALALSAYAQPTASGTYQLTLAKINAAIGSGTLAVAKIGGGTPAAGKYVDGGTGNWTTLPTATTDASLLTTGTLPLARLVNITTTEISATAGIVAGQIASIPSQAASIITSGQLALARGGTGVDLSAGGGTGFVLKQASGGAITSAALVAADIPAHNASAANLTSGAIASAARLSTSGTADSTTFLRGDLTWATPSGGSSNISLSNITSGTLATDLVVGAKNIEFTGAGTGDTAKSLIYADGNAGNVTLQVPSAKTLTVKSGTIAGAVLGNGVYTVGDVGSGGHFYSDSTTARIKNGSATQFQCFTTGAYIDRSDALYIRTTGGTNKYKLSDTLIETPALSIGGTIGSSTNPSTGGLALTGKFYISTSQTPASSGATGTTGQICWDASYLYVCVNTNSWTRVAIATW